MITKRLEDVSEHASCCIEQEMASRRCYLLILISGLASAQNRTDATSVRFKDDDAKPLE
jgi:hypothetical protein